MNKFSFLILLSYAASLSSMQDDSGLNKPVIPSLKQLCMSQIEKHIATNKIEPTAVKKKMTPELRNQFVSHVSGIPEQNKYHAIYGNTYPKPKKTITKKRKISDPTRLAKRDNLTAQILKDGQVIVQCNNETPTSFMTYGDCISISSEGIILTHRKEGYIVNGFLPDGNHIFSLNHELANVGLSEDGNKIIVQALNQNENQTEIDLQEIHKKIIYVEQNELYKLIPLTPKTLQNKLNILKATRAKIYRDLHKNN